MSNGIKRIGKGMLAIFMIKLSLVVGVLAFQACQTESNFENEVHEEAKTNFLAALQESNDRLHEIVIQPSATKGDDKNDGLLKENNDEITTFKMCLLLNQDDPIDPSNTGVIDPTAVNTLGDVIDVGNDTGTRPSAIDDDVADVVANDPVAFGFSACFDIPTEPTVAVLDPAVIEAKNFLYSQGFNDNDILEMLDGEDEVYLVPVTIAMINALNESSLASFDNNGIYKIIGLSTVYAQGSGDNYVDRSWSCFLEATGAATLMEGLKGVQQGNKAILKKLGKKGVKKLAAKFLGPIGIVIAVIEFTFCMNR